jgi:hypothetical protein
VRDAQIVVSYLDQISEAKVGEPIYGLSIARLRSMREKLGRKPFGVLVWEWQKRRASLGRAMELPQELVE